MGDSGSGVTHCAAVSLSFAGAAVTSSVAIVALEVGHVAWRRVLPCASSNGPHDAERIQRIADRPVISTLFNPQFGAGPFERLIAIIVLAVAHLPVPSGVKFHGTAPAILVADLRRNKEPKAFRGQQERLAVKVGIPGINRSVG